MTRTVIYTLGNLDKNNSIILPQKVIHSSAYVMPVYKGFDHNKPLGTVRIVQEGNELVTYDSLDFLDKETQVISIGFISQESEYTKKAIVKHSKIELVSLGLILKRDAVQ